MVLLGLKLMFYEKNKFVEEFVVLKVFWLVLLKFVVWLEILDEVWIWFEGDFFEVEDVFVIKAVI